MINTTNLSVEARQLHLTRAFVIEYKRTLDQVRRRVQNETMGRRGHKEDPLYRARKLLIRADERLDERGRAKLMEALRRGDPFDEVLGAWLAKEACRSIYHQDEVESGDVVYDDHCVNRCASF